MTDDARTRTAASPMPNAGSTGRMRWVMGVVMGVAARLLALRVVRFALVGGTATAVHAGTTILLVDGLGLRSAALAAILGTVAGIATSYLGNWAWTFEARSGHAHHLPRFLAVYALVMGLNGAVMYVLADRLGIHYLLPLVLTLTVSPVLTFLLNQRFVFADRSPGRPSGR